MQNINYMLLAKNVTKVFVTGGAGFIGSHLVDMLLADGKKVTCFDNLSSGRHEWIKPHLKNKNFNFIHADMLNVKILNRAMRGQDLVWHLGANSDIPGGYYNTNMDLQNNVVATRNVLESMRINKIPHMLFASTGALYGEIGEIPFKESNGPLFPISLYGGSKLACEAFIGAYCNLFGIKAWIFRFGNVIGNRMSHGIIYDFLRKLKKNSKTLEILGNGKGAKNYFLVEECILGIDYVFKHAKLTKQPCDIFNLGTDTRTGVIEIAKIIVEEMGLANVGFSLTDTKRGWPGDQPQVFLSVEKVKKLGWYPKYSSTEAVHIATRRMLGAEKFIYETS